MKKTAARTRKRTVCYAAAKKQGLLLHIRTKELREQLEFMLFHIFSDGRELAIVVLWGLPHLLEFMKLHRLITSKDYEAVLVRIVAIFFCS